MTGYYRTLAEYNAHVEAARTAYRADQSVEAGYCAVCHRRKRDQTKRRCWECRHEGHVEVSA